MACFFLRDAQQTPGSDWRVLTTGDPDNRGGDLFDVGVMRFTGEAMPPYPDVDKFSMDISYLKPSHLPRSGIKARPKPSSAV
jgi:hypothetical protein